MKKTFIMVAAFASALFITGCSSSQKVTKTVGVTEETTDTFSVHPEDIKSEVLNIYDALRLFDDCSLENDIIKKYNYKKTEKYIVYNLESYNTMLYKNCALARKHSDNGFYQDLPKPQRKGISSYVGFTDSSIEVGVFNNKTYLALVDQIITAGFKLKADGYEKIYSNGIYDISCYAPGHRIIIRKAL